MQKQISGGLSLKKLHVKIKPWLGTIDKYGDTIKTLAQIASLGATVASLGLAGDTAIEFGIVSLNGFQVLNTILKLNNIFKKKGAQYLKIAKILLKSEFKGIDSVKEKFELFKEALEELDDKDEFIEKFCEPIKRLIQKIAELVGNAISTGIPNDNFIISHYIQKLITDGINNATEKSVSATLTGIINSYEKVPESFQSVLEDHEEMAKIIKKIFGLLKKKKNYQ